MLYKFDDIFELLQMNGLDDSSFPIIYREEFETNRPEYNMVNGVIYRYKGDFKYYDQVLEIVKELDWKCVYSMAIVKYKNMGFKSRMNMSPSELIPLLQKDGIHVLQRVVQEDIKCYSCGLFTAYNNGGCLLLEFTPETWEASSTASTEDGLATKAAKLNRIDFKKIR